MQELDGVEVRDGQVYALVFLAHIEDVIAADAGQGAERTARNAPVVERIENGTHPFHDVVVGVLGLVVYSPDPVFPLYAAALALSKDAADDDGVGEQPAERVLKVLHVPLLQGCEGMGIGHPYYQGVSDFRTEIEEQARLHVAVKEKLHPPAALKHIERDEGIRVGGGGLIDCLLKNFLALLSGYDGVSFDEMPLIGIPVPQGVPHLSLLDEGTVVRIPCECAGRVEQQKKQIKSFHRIASFCLVVAKVDIIL